MPFGANILKKKCLKFVKIANSIECIYKTQKTAYMGCLSVRIYGCLAIPNETQRGSPLSLCNNHSCRLQGTN